ncbi:hypothetical protein ACS5PU_01080 [Pedobacter sp. GSP4]|uniref:hypothetical protein n=1 Tax=Pedobacter sp. GSP4 TaxID=3453716 RepID=UPI003EEA57C7
MKYLIIMLSLCSVAVHAQFVSERLGDMRGAPLREIKYENVSGTPYLLDFWSKGNVTTKSGKRYADLQLKYDIMGDQLIYQDAGGNPMYFVDPLSAFEITTVDSSANYKFINGLPAIDGLNQASFFQLIATGKLTLLKRVYKKITESKEYGSATVDKSFNTYSGYYVLQNSALSKISINKKSLLGLAPDKEKEITDYLKKEKIELKEDKDLSKFFAYLNKQ